MTLWTLAHRAPLFMEFSRQAYSWESSRPRDQAWVSCIVGRFFTIWATREAPWLVHGKCYLSVLVFSWLEDKGRSYWESPLQSHLPRNSTPLQLHSGVSESLSVCTDPMSSDNLVSNQLYFKSVLAVTLKVMGELWIWSLHAEKKIYLLILKSFFLPY